MANPHHIALIWGDKRAPRDTLQLNSVATDAVVYLQDLSAPPGPLNILWSGQSVRFSGQDRVTSSRDNSQLSIVVDFVGDSTDHAFMPAHLIDLYGERARAWEESREGAPVWLRWHPIDSIDVDAPVIGQYYFYWRVLALDIPEGVTRDQMGNLVVGASEEVVIEITASPEAEGIEQVAFTDCGGQLEHRPQGIYTGGGPASTNEITNPEFGHPTDWDNGWSVSNAALYARQDRRYFRSKDSAARLINSDTSNHNFTQTLTLTSDTYIIACKARLPDKSAVDSNILQMIGQGSARTTEFINLDDDGWYLCFASFSGAASSTTHGIQVKAGKEVTVDQIICGIVGLYSGIPTPFFSGDSIGCSWDGTAHESSSSKSTSRIERTLNDELAGQYTILIWLTPLFDHDDFNDAATDTAAILYYSDGTSTIGIEYIGLGDILRLSRTGVSDIDSSAQTFDYGDHILLAVIQEESTLRFVINGVEAGNESAEAGFDPDILLALGNYETGHIGTFDTTIAGILDGFRVFRSPLTVANILDIYNNEKPVKDDGKAVGGPLFNWTKDDDGAVDAVGGEVSSSDKDNFSVVGGIAGNATADTRIEFDGTTDIRGYWIGRKATADFFAHYQSAFLDFSGTSDSGSSSGDAYEGSGDVQNYTFDQAVTEPKAIRGEAFYVARIKVVDDDAKIWPYYRIGSGQIIRANNPTTLKPHSRFLLQKVGGLAVGWPQPDPMEASKYPISLEAGLQIEAANADDLVNDLQAFWSLDETAGPRYDQARGHHLSEFGAALSSTTGKIKNAPDFTVNEYLMTAGTGGLSNSGKMSVFGWFYLDSKGITRYLFSKWITADYSREWLLWYNNGTDRFQFTVSSDGTSSGQTGVTANALGPPSTATWYWIEAYYDETNIGIRIDNGTADTAAHTTGIFQGSTPVVLGAAADGALKWDGRIDMAGILTKRVLTSAERTLLYNSGSGRDWPFDETEVDLDFVQVFTPPYTEIYGDVPFTTNPVIVAGRDAWIEDNSPSGDQHQRLTFNGQPITLVPDHYNYLSFLIGRDGDDYDVSKSVSNLKIKVTPKIHNPGGAWA